MSHNMRDMLLSEYHEKYKEVPLAILEDYQAKIMILMAQPNKTEEEKVFINDYLASIVDVKIANDNKKQLSAPPPSALSNINPTSSAAQTVKLNELVVVPDKFDGGRKKARRWLDDYERAAESNSWNEATKTKYFRAYMVGAASDWFAVFASNVSNWTQLKSSFTNYYVGKEADLGLERDLKDSIQGQTESCSSFIARYARLLQLSDPSICQTKMVNSIRIRLKPDIVERLSSHTLTSIDSLNLACCSIEDGMIAYKAAENLRRSGANRNEKTINQDKGRADERVGNRASGDARKITCTRCDRPNHKREDCFASTRRDGSELVDKAPKEKPTRNQSRPSRKTTGAVAAEEAQSDDEPEPTITISKRTSASIVSSSMNAERTKLILHKVIVNGQELFALIDTGSVSSLIRAETASMNGWVPKGPAPELASADNSPIKCFGHIRANLTFSLNDITKTVEGAKFTVAESLCCEAIIGMDSLSYLRLVIDPEDKSIFFKPEAKGVIVSTQEHIPPRSLKSVEARVPPGTTGAIQTIPFNQGDKNIIVANVIDTVQDDRITCLVGNLGDQPKYLKLGHQLASFEHITSDDFSNSHVSATVEIADTQHFMTIGDDLSTKQVNELSELLSSNVKAFSINGQLGCTDAFTHDIELIEGAKPHAEPLRRRPIPHQEETRRQIKDMLEKEIIEESNSPWAAAYVLAKKKSGEMRLCVDFRKLNDLTKKCVYPLPNIEDCIESLAGKRYFSQLDMASGFWQLPLSERAKELTAFRTEDGQFQFRRMPFGLTNAPASFQRLINVVFSGLKGLSLQMFIDDLCIASSTWDEHLRLLDQVFKLLIRSKLKLKVNKCLLGVPKVTFLGHEISADGIRQDPSKLQALKKLPEPTNVKELRAVIGMLNYYRKFVPGFSILAEPLTRLTKTKQAWSWGEEQRIAFNKIIEHMLANGTLKHYDRKAPTALKTDACRIGIASILLQQQEGEWRIVTCKSRRLRPNEANYGVTELEALAIVEAVTQLRNYLLGIKFKIITDHCALCQVFKHASTNSRLNRWRLVLQEYDFEVMYTKGSMHSDVDCLSRAPLEEETDDFLENKLMAIRNKTVAAATRTTTLISPLKPDEWQKLLSEDDEARQFDVKAKHRRDGFKQYNNLLYKDNKLYVPQQKRKQTLEAAHSGETSVHGGIKQTLNRLDCFWWPRMQSDVTTMVESCVTCQRRKNPRQTLSGEYNSFESNEIFELVAMDVMELPASLNGKKYAIVAIDTFSRFVVAKAMKKLVASSFIKFLTEMFGCFGIPQNILTDGAPIFINEQSAELAKQFGFTHRKSTPHHHQGNGQAERMIQNVKNKLAMLVDSRPVDWEASLGQALLSINSAVCDTTGFTPFEMMFGRKHNNFPEFKLHDPAMEAYMTARRSHMNELSATARESITKAQHVAKQRYDSTHAPIKFNMGDSVMLRRMGRLSKLTNRWEGPFTIHGQKSTDIYLVKSNDNSKLIERHVKDMKPFIAALTASIFALIINTSKASLVFERVPPILWLETEQYVSPGYTRYKFRILFGSPCSVLLQENGEEGMLAYKRCEEVYKDNIISRLLEFTPTFKQNPQLQQAQSNALMGPSPVGYPATVQQHQPGLPQQHLPGMLPAERLLSPVLQGQGHQLPLPPGLPQSNPHGLVTRGVAKQIAYERDQTVDYPVAIWEDGEPYPMEIWQERPKRDVGLSTAFATYAVVNNVLSTALDRWWPNQATRELQEHEQQLARALQNLTTALNITQLGVTALNEAVINQATLINHNVAEIAEMKVAHSQLMVLVAHIIAKIVTIGAGLERLRIGLRRRQLDLPWISTTTGTTVLDEVESDSIVDKSIKGYLTAPTTLDLEFIARQRDRSTKIYQVKAFEFWANLTEEQPKLLRYDGPKYLAFNETNRCVKGIGTPDKHWVNLVCEKENYEDQSLAKWTPIITTGDPWHVVTPSVVKESWPFVYVYCFPHQISIMGMTNECPPYVHKINASMEFTLSDGYAYKPQAIEILSNVEYVVSQVHSIHFKNTSLAINENQAIRRVIEMREQLRKANEKLYMFQFDKGGGVSYFQVTTLGVIIILVGTAIVVFIRHSMKQDHADLIKKNEENHRRTLDAVNDIYNNPTYEQPGTSRRPTRDDQGQIQMSSFKNNIPTMAKPLPASALRGGCHA